MKVCEAVITSSPGPRPSASKTSSSAVVPFDTPTPCGTCENAANSSSNALVSWALMNDWRSTTRSIAAAISACIDARCAWRSTSGMRLHGQRRQLDPLAALCAGCAGRLEHLDDAGRLLEVRDRVGPGGDAVEEVPALGGERLDVGDARHVEVAHPLDQAELVERAEVGERLVHPLAVDAGVVDRSPGRRRRRRRPSSCSRRPSSAAPCSG